MKKLITICLVTVVVLLASAIANADNIYVSCRIGGIKKFDSSGNGSTFCAGAYCSNGLAFDSSGNLYVAGEYYWVNKYDPSGKFLLNFSAGYMMGGLAFDSSGNLYIANGDVIQGYGYIDPVEQYISKVDFDSGVPVTTVFASGVTDANLRYPTGLAFDMSGNLYVANSFSGTIEKFDSSGNGSIFASGLNWPTGLAFDSSGYLYAVNNGNSTIEKFDSSGNMSTFASAFNYPYGIAFDSSGNLYVTAGPIDELSGRIYKYDSSGNWTIFASGLECPSFIAVQVPEPATLLLLGLGGLALLRKRRV